MRLHRFYFDEEDLNKFSQNSEIFELKNKDLSHQLLKVFRFKNGQEIILFNGDGFEYHSILNLKDKNIFISIKEKLKNKIEDKKEIILFQSLIKKDNFELIAQKATELGVSKIVPIISERSEKKEINEERIRKIMTEAAEQSGRSRVPILGPIVSLKNALFQKPKNVLAFDPIGKPFHEGGSCTYISCGVISFFIGPEGGWTGKEIEMFKEQGSEILSLGDGVLKAETAALAALTLLTL